MGSKDELYIGQTEDCPHRSNAIWDSNELSAISNLNAVESVSTHWTLVRLPCSEFDTKLSLASGSLYKYVKVRFSQKLGLSFLLERSQYQPHIPLSIHSFIPYVHCARFNSLHSLSPLC